jgi:chitin disaccharide deacetylase
VSDGAPPRYVIFNADDFGASTGINRGIVEAHTRGVVTSASLMVTGRACPEAAALARDHPDLAVGLHWDVWGEDERSFDLGDEGAVRAEVRRQLDDFHRLVGRAPTHVDSHKHAHLDERVLPVVRELVEPLCVPVRADGAVEFVGGFYAQWEWEVTELEHVGMSALQGILRNETADGWTEISCHPGYRGPDFTSVYDAERETELATLTDPAVRRTLDECGLQLASYADWAGVVGSRSCT